MNARTATAASIAERTTYHSSAVASRIGKRIDVVQQVTRTAMTVATMIRLLVREALRGASDQVAVSLALLDRTEQTRAQAVTVVMASLLVREALRGASDQVAVPLMGLP